MEKIVGFKISGRRRKLLNKLEKDDDSVYIPIFKNELVPVVSLDWLEKEIETQVAFLEDLILKNPHSKDRFMVAINRLNGLLSEAKKEALK